MVLVAEAVVDRYDEDDLFTGQNGFGLASGRAQRHLLRALSGLTTVSSARTSLRNPDVRQPQ